MKLSVIIVSYNVRHYLGQCLLSVSRAIAGMDAEVIVFDNHSKDNTVHSLQHKYPNVTFIQSNHNLGFARGNNRAIGESSGEYVLLLNPDTIIGEDTLRQAVAFMDAHPRVGSVGVRMLKADGADAKESRRGVPTPMTAFYKMTGLCDRFPKSHRFGKYYMGYLPWDEPCRIEIVSGAFCMLRRKALDQVGLLDEDFFMYGEDIDLSYRLLKGGWENWYLPLKILHYKGESTVKTSFRYVHVFYESMLIFFRKHYGHLGALLAMPVQLGIYVKASVALMGILGHKARKQLGFVIRRDAPDPLFVMHLEGRSLERCRKLAKRKGLRVAEANDDTSNAEGKKDTDKEQTIYDIYDPTRQTFTEILENISARPVRNRLLATFYPQENMIITDAEIIK